MNSTPPYFAYGSNLHPVRLEQRIGQPVNGTVAVLRRATLRFNKRGIDGSGKCNLMFTDSVSDMVMGVAYEVTPNQSRRLDDWEATTCGYDRIDAVVERLGRPVTVFTYQARDEVIDAELVPFDWYKQLVLLGASYFGFPPTYVEQLRMQPALPDGDLVRRETAAALLAQLEQANIRNFLHRRGTF